MQQLKECESNAKNKSQKKKCLDDFHRISEDYSKFLKKNAIRKVRHGADRRKIYTKTAKRNYETILWERSKKSLKGR